MSVLHHPVSGEDPMRDHARTRVGSHSNQWNPTISAVLFGLPILRNLDLHATVNGRLRDPLESRCGGGGHRKFCGQFKLSARLLAFPHNPTCSSKREERGGLDANQPRTVGTLSRVSLGTPAVLARSMPATGARSLDWEGCGKECIAMHSRRLRGSA